MALHFKPHFETEAWGNSERAYDQFPTSEKVCTCTSNNVHWNLDLMRCQFARD